MKKQKHPYGHDFCSSELRSNFFLLLALPGNRTAGLWKCGFIDV